MGRSNKKNNNDCSMSDARKKANREERREIKQILNEGRYEGLVKEKKFIDYNTEWDD